MNDSLITEYLLGQLDEQASRAFDARLGRDDTLARQCAEVAEALAALAPSAPPAADAAELRERVVASLHGERRFDGLAPRIARLFDVDDRRARKLVRRAARGPGWGWLPYRERGVRVLPVRCGPALGGARGAIVHLARGANLARHRHRGAEQMLVLDGYARENAGREVAPGDLIVSEPGSEHRFEILQDAPCVFACTLAGGIDWLPD